MMRALVTGAPGWLGTRLVDKLRDSYDVRCLVLKGIDAGRLGAEVVHGDIATGEGLDQAVKDVDVVFHCAGIIHPKRTRDFFKINRDGTKNLLEASAAVDVKRFVYVSSNSAQGTNVSRDALMKESDACRPRSAYGRSKLQAEQVVNEYAKKGIETVIIRPCWFYGPGQPERMTKLIRMIKKGRPLVFGDGQNLRSMSYVDNVVSGLLLAAESRRANGQTYWIADEKPYKTIEIYGTVAELLGVAIKPRRVPALVSRACESLDSLVSKAGFYSINLHVAGEMTHNIACSIEKAKSELGYSPKVSLRDGMEISIEWCRQNNLLL